MRVELVVEIDGGLELSAASSITRLRDIAALGRKLVTLPVNANRLMAGIRDREVKKCTVKTTTEAPKQRGKSKGRTARSRARTTRPTTSASPAEAAAS